jgi:hypothetical protein
MVFSAPSAAASSPATVSALTLQAAPFSSADYTHLARIV